MRCHASGVAGPPRGGPRSVVRDFNGWDHDAAPLRLHGDSLVAEVSVRAGSTTYACRYLDGGRRFDDDAADRYELNELGLYHCVIDLEDV